MLLEQLRPTRGSQFWMLALTLGGARRCRRARILHGYVVIPGARSHPARSGGPSARGRRSRSRSTASRSLDAAAAAAAEGDGRREVISSGERAGLDEQVRQAQQIEPRLGRAHAPPRARRAACGHRASCTRAAAPRRARTARARHRLHRLARRRTPCDLRCSHSSTSGSASCAAPAPITRNASRCSERDLHGFGWRGVHV